MWEEGGIQWTNGMVGHIIVRMGIPSMGGGGVPVNETETVILVVTETY